MNPQQLAQMQAMAAQQRGMAGGAAYGTPGAAGANPYLQQQQAAAAYGTNPYLQQQQAAAAQQQQAPAYQQPPPAAAPAPTYTAPQAAPTYSAPPPGPVVGGDQTTISVGFSDGTLVGYDRLRRSFIMTGKFNGMLSTTTTSQVPARPLLNIGAETVNPVTGEKTVAPVTIAQEAPPTPVTMSGSMTKLGFKKGPFGLESWQTRHFELHSETLTYAKDAGSVLNTIKLTTGCKVRVVDATTPARKDRFEDNDNPGVVGMMTQPIGVHMQLTSGPIGKDNCVELHVPVQVGAMLNGVMGQSAIGLAFGGGIKEMQKNRARTYYMSCESRAEAEAWCNAIDNNIRALTAPAPNSPGGQFGYLDNVMNNAYAMQNAMADAQDPNKSLQWYKRTLGTDVSMNELYEGLCRFYDQLDRYGVPHN